MIIERFIFVLLLIIGKHRGRMSSGLNSIYNINLDDDQYSCCKIVMAHDSWANQSFAELRRSRSVFCESQGQRRYLTGFEFGIELKP